MSDDVLIEVLLLAGHLLILVWAVLRMILDNWPAIVNRWQHRIWGIDAMWCAMWYVGPGSWIVLISVAVALAATTGLYIYYRYRTNI